MSKATALAGRYVAYAMHFMNDSRDDPRDEPTDEAIERGLSGCVRAPRPEEYAKIRAEVLAWRKYGMTCAEVEELADPQVVWSITRGDLNRIAGRTLTGDECDAAVKAVDQGDVLDLVRATVAGMLGGPDL